MSTVTSSSTATDSSAGSSTDPRIVGQRFVDEVLNAHDLGDALNELVAEDFVEQNPLPGQGPGRAGLRDVLGMMNTAFPDIHWDVRDMLVEGDRVMTLSFWTGTHQGEFLGVPATGRRVSVEAWTLDRYSRGQLVESRIIMDVVGLLGQVGAIPAPPAG